MSGFDLTAYMRANGILRIADLGEGFSVAMRGNILGTGKTVGEAISAALRDRAARKEAA